MATAVVNDKNLMEAMIAACAVVAHADGQVDEAERRRILQLMSAISAFGRFSSDDVMAEFERQERAFAFEPTLALERALETIEALAASPSEAKMLLYACQQILEADGFDHPNEYRALQRIGKSLPSH